MGNVAGAVVAAGGVLLVWRVGWETITHYRRTGRRKPAWATTAVAVCAAIIVGLAVLV